MRIAVLPAVAALALASCTKETVVTNDEPATSTPVPIAPVPATPAPGVAATAPPAPSAASPATAKPASQLAPEGVFYLVVPVRIEMPDGVHGLPPGTGVKLVRPGIYLTPYGEKPLPPEQLTNDLNAARAARDAYAATQMAMQQRSAAEASAIAAKTRVVDTQNGASREGALKEIERQKKQAELERMKQQFTAMQTQIINLRAKVDKESYNRMVKNRAITSTSRQQLTAAENQSDALRERIADAEHDLQSMP